MAVLQGLSDHFVFSSDKYHQRKPAIFLEGHSGIQVIPAELPRSW